MNPQPETPTKKKAQYPQGCRMLQVRDCTVDICLKNNPGSVLLSTFLFWLEYPHTGDFYDEKSQTFTMRRTQADIEKQSCKQIDTKTIHDTAVPLLQLLRYLTVKEKMGGNLYILHVDRINAAYAVCRNPEALHDFLKSLLQLESALIKIPDDQLEPTLINKRALYFQLERILIATRADSNCQRGRKRKPQASTDGQIPPIESNRDLLEINTEREERGDNVTPTPSLLVASTSHTHSSSVDSSFSSEDETPEASDVQTTQAAPLGHVQSAQGGAIDPPSSVGVPSDDTLNLDTQPISSDPVGECALPADTLPIVTLTHTALTTAQEGTPHERLYEQGMKDANTAKETPDNAALSTEVAQGVMAKATAMAPPCVTPMAEVSRVTQEGAAPKKTRKAAVKRDLFAEASVEVQSAITEWRSIFKRPGPVTQTLVDQATILAACEPEPGEIAACRLWMYKTDHKKWYSTHGMHLGDVVREFPKFQSLGEIPDNVIPIRTEKAKSLNVYELAELARAEGRVVCQS